MYGTTIVVAAAAAAAATEPASMQIARRPGHVRAHYQGRLHDVQARLTHSSNICRRTHITTHSHARTLTGRGNGRHLLATNGVVGAAHQTEEVQALRLGAGVQTAQRGAVKLQSVCTYASGREVGGNHLTSNRCGIRG